MALHARVLARARERRVRGLRQAVPAPGAGAQRPADRLRLRGRPLDRGARRRRRHPPHLRRGQTTPIWIVDLATSKVLERIPRGNVNDSNPIWVEDKIYFISDRSGPRTLFVYDMKTKQVAELVKNTGLDIKSASAGPGAIV